MLDVQAAIDDLASRFTVAELALDPWRAAAIGAECEARGMTVVEFGQTETGLCLPVRRVQAAGTRPRPR